MTSPLLLDTHIWIWLAEGRRRFPAALTDEMQRASEANRLFISAISVWEFAMLVYRRRFDLDDVPAVWVKRSCSRLGLEILPMDADISLESYALPGEFHGDPADRMIVATARLRGATLVTQDTKILAYAKKHRLSVLK